MKVEIKSVEHVSDEALRLAMNCAFSDYAVPMELSGRIFALMMRQRGLDRVASRIAVIAGEIAAIWLVSVRGHRVYLISSGTCPAFRRQGLARRLAEDCLTDLRQRRIASFQTEVLVHNNNAFDLYTSLGMMITRRLECYDLPRPMEPAKHAAHQIPWEVIEDKVLPLAEVEPSWQNSFSAIGAVADDVTCWTVSDDRGLAGYAAVIPETGTLAQIAVRKDRRCDGIAKSLISVCHRGDNLRLINVDGRSDSFLAFLQAIGAEPTVSQFELNMRVSGANER